MSLNIKANFKKAREEMLIGGLGGGISYFVYARYNNINPLRTFALQSQGIIDKVWTTLPTENLITLKVMFMFIVIGIVVGSIVGVWFNPLKWGR